ncbi:MAG: helix-hairpin-helix domain-containing protein [Rhodobacteraceae bacterium]|nr:helix-hairpin-helix domain-containing protein [Paracoccaceae bacterium]
MAGMTVSELIKRQDEARELVTESLKKVAVGKAADPAEAIARLDLMIAGQKAQVAAAREAQAEASRRFDAEIKAREDRIVELERQVEQFKDGSSKSQKPTTPGSFTGGSGNLLLKQIGGIGPKTESRLAAGGITDIAILSRTSEDRVAQLLGITPDKAAEYVKEAKRLTRG